MAHFAAPRRRLRSPAMRLIHGLLLSLALIGCGSAVDETTGTPFEPTECTSTPVEHAAACPAPCAIEVDLEVTCSDKEVAAPGLRVAPAPDTTWLATSSSHDRMLFQAGPAGAERVGDDVLPTELVRRTPFLALAPDGDAQMIGPTSPLDGWGITEHWAGLGQTWDRTVIHTQSSPAGLEIDPAGVPHASLVLKGHKPAIATLDGGAWTITEVSVPEGAEWVQTTLTAGGQDAIFAITGDNGSWQHHVFIAGQDHLLGAKVATTYPLGYVPAQGPSTDLGPPVAAAILYADGLRVVWPEADSFTEIPIPDTPAIEPVCDRSGGLCGDTCTDQRTGVLRNSMALARTADGHLWLAYVETTIDIVVQYEGGCPDPEECGCAANILADNGTSTLHLVRIRPDGSPPQSVLVLPIRRYAVETFDTFWEAAILDARGFGSDLAIGVRTMEDLELAWKDSAIIRLLRIDTSKLPP